MVIHTPVLSPNSSAWSVFFMNWTKTLIACFLCAVVIAFINFVLRTQSNCPAPQECPPEVVEGGSDATQDTPNTRVRSYSDAPIPPLLQEYAFRVFFPRGVDRQNEKYTLIIQTYKRVKVLEKLLAHYCNLERVDKILVLWNDLQTPVPQSLKSFKCALPLVVIREKENRMTNRFRPRPEIKTDAVMIIDDDRWIELDDMLQLFRAWQDFRHRLIGFEHRMHSRDSNGKYHYGPGWKWGDTPEKLGYSMMITPQCIFHRVYLELFFLPQFTPTEVLNYIDKEMNCDDIALNFVVAKFLEQVSFPQASGLSLANKHPVKNLAGQSGTYVGLSVSRQAKHYDVRTDCLNLLAKHFNGFPLHYTFIGVTERW